MVDRKIIAAELLLITGSVFIFRGLWHLMDKIDFMNSSFFLWFSFAFGIIVSVFSFHYLMKKK